MIKNNIVFISDIHAGVRNDNSVFLDYMEDYFTNEFFPYIDDLGVRYAFVLGDLFDRRKFINYNTLQRINDFFFKPLEKRRIIVYMIPGNHDVAYKNTNKLNSLDLLLRPYKNVFIQHEPTIISLNNRKIGLVPWINKENYDICVDFIKNNAQNVDILGGHFDIQGVEMLKGITSDVGFDQSFFADYKQVISGHYHTPSINGNIWYPGSPLEFTWADYGQEKGYVVYNTDKDELTKIPTKSKMFYKIYYDDSSEFELKKLQSGFSEYKNKYIKVIVRSKKSKTKFEQFIANLHNHNPFDVKIVESDLEFGLSDDEMNIETKSTVEIIDSTIDNMNLNISKANLKKLFHELYTEAMNIEV